MNPLHGLLGSGEREGGEHGVGTEAGGQGCLCAATGGAVASEQVALERGPTPVRK